MDRLVRFEVTCETKWGEVAGVVGSCPALGAWDKSKALVLDTGADAYPVWTGEVPCPVGQTEFKLVLVSDGAVKKWEDKLPNNRTLDVDPSDTGETLEIKLCYGDRARKSSPRASGGTFHTEVDCSQMQDPFAKAIVQQNAVNRSWRTRLQFVRSMFTDASRADEAGFDPQKNQHLVYLVVYLTFLKSGQIVCAEDGTHYRPNHHANEAKMIEEALAKMSNDSNTFLIRKMYPLLPSYKSDFTASVPLTRIRDIAHRNDIPHDMKQRIKHQLQNPLHRCASPEHLVLTEQILGEITSYGANYSGGFVDQFRIFHRELLEFFNATSLDDQLHDIKNRKEPSSDAASKIETFLHRKGAREMASSQLEALIEVREEFAKRVGDLQGEVLQRVRLCDVALEDFAFVLLAGMAKEVDESGQTFDRAIAGSLFATRNLILSGVASRELSCCWNELKRLSSMGQSDLLSLRANFERLSRFCGSFSEAVSSLYEEHVVQLGQALGVDGHAISVFAEAEIRSHIVFHLASIASHGLKVARQLLKLPPWDPLWTGKATGRLMTLKNLHEISGSTKCILLLQEAVGDEDIPSNVQGIVLSHELPHLSHLGVRARQSNVVFVSAQESGCFSTLQSTVADLDRQLVQLEVSFSGEVKIGLSSGDSDAAAGTNGDAPAKPVSVAECDLSGTCPVGVIEATVSSCGSKAHFAGRLQQAAQSCSEEASFLSPGGQALPFGCFTSCLTDRKDSYVTAIEEYNSAENSVSEDQALDRLRSIVEGTSISESVVQCISDMYSGNVRLMVRSSANCEDLEDMSGAGLYDSFSNIPSCSHEALRRSIKDVWKSLWTKRASQSRKQYKVPHESAYMACLIQPMVLADVSFIMFSQNPVSRNEKQVYMELAVGMGETLASATSQGVPYRATYDRETKQIECLSLSSYTEALVPRRADGGFGLDSEFIDYSRTPLTSDQGYRNATLSRLGAIAVYLEDHFGSAQDIEGVVSGADVHVVQTRPMVLG